MAQATDPNRGIVLIIVDDLFSVEHYRNKFGIRISTPNFDKLMRRGVSFMNAFCATALCNPSRTSIFTGKNPFKTGIHYNYDSWGDIVSETLFARLKTAGYYVWSCGKTMHTNVELSTTPLAPYLDWTYYRVWTPDADPDPYTVPMAIQRMRFLPAGKPYFAAIGLIDPHLPFISADRFRNLYPPAKLKIPDWTGDRPPNWVLPYLRTGYLNALTKQGTLDDFVSGYLANISEMDFSLGRLIDNIDKWGRSPVIIVTSDHGFTLGDHDHIGKFTLWDEAGRAPLIIVDPDLPSDRRNLRVADTVSLLDIAPTILDYAGVAIPSDMDGQSLKPLMFDPNSRRNLGALTTMFGAVSLRTNSLRYTRYHDNARSPDGEEEMFNMVRDPEAKTNLIGRANTVPYLAKYLADLRAVYATTLASWMGAAPKCDVITSPPGKPIVRKQVC